MNYLLTCLELKSKKDENFLGTGKVNAFKCYKSLVNNMPDSTIYYGNKALAIYREHNDTSYLINLHSKLAKFFYILGSTDSAESHYFNGLYYAMYKKDNAHTQIFASNLGTMAFKKAYFDLVSQYFDKALKVILHSLKTKPSY